MNKKKIILSTIFFILIIGITFYAIFSKTSLDTILNNLKVIKWYYILICAILVAMYFVFQGLYIKYILKSMGEKRTLIKCIFYGVTEFFFSGITPGAMGGQPIELLYMTKDKIPMRKSLITLILSTVLFKLCLVTMGIIVLFVRPEYVYDVDDSITVLFFWGIICDSSLIIFFSLCMFNKTLVNKLFSIYNKIKNKLFKKKKLNNNKIEKSLRDYNEEVKYIKEHKKEVFISLLLTFLQRMCMFSVIYVIYKSLGFSDYNYLDLILLQIVAQACVNGLPLPGGTGAMEKVSAMLYVTLFGTLASSAMLLNRTIIFYVPLFIAMVLLLGITKKKYDDIF